MEKENIKIGMEATVQVGSDSYPYVVVDILRNGLQVVLQAMDAKPGPGHNYFGDQKWIYTANPNGEIVTANRKRKNGHYYVEKYMPVSFGVARKYSDPSF